MLAPIGGEARLALNLGAGHMLAHPAIVNGYYEPLVAHDMDGDGRDDVAARSGSNAVLLHSLGDGRFAPPQVAGSLPGLRFVAAGDFDGDGHADLALISDQGAVRVLPGLPQGGFGTPWDGSLAWRASAAWWPRRAWPTWTATGATTSPWPSPPMA